MIDDDKNSHTPGLARTHFSSGIEDMSQDLVYAAMAGDTKWVLQLLRENVDVNQRGSGGRVALLEAVRAGHLEIVMILLAAKANVKERVALGETALHYAARLGHYHIIELLLDAKADVNAKTEHTHATPLHL